MTTKELEERIFTCKCCGKPVKTKSLQKLVFHVGVWIAKRLGVSDTEIIIQAHKIRASKGL